MTLYVAALSADLTEEDLAAIEGCERTIYVEEIIRLADVYEVSLDYLEGMADPGWMFHYTPEGGVELVARDMTTRRTDP